MKRSADGRTGGWRSVVVVEVEVTGDMSWSQGAIRVVVDCIGMGNREG